MATGAGLPARPPADQREVLVRALEAGYFDVPRKVTLPELADDLGVPPDIAAVWLRRATKIYLRNALGRGG